MSSKNIPLRKILVTGCGRSGTKYITYLLCKLGLDVKHERMGKDGIASWLMAVNSQETPWGPARNSFNFQQIFHQVRHPLTAIPSIATFRDQSWQYAEQYIPITMSEPPLLRAAKYWYYWNIEAEKIAQWRYRIEYFPSVYEEFCGRLQLHADPAVLNQMSEFINTRKYGRLYHWYEEFCARIHLATNKKIVEILSTPALANQAPLTCTWEILHTLDPSLTLMIQRKTVEYEYDL